eukprot:CAMPEP_0202694052 /NCGR_PEP_ID=MMETSP1385-20130828/8014_1 /ASSEMBLY_ACC=CAM_ASM_000861 /TAXON_ID=933848 /ORGANISM="Elphidium margaritaceum" /LENGTH=373 /DNA_ID=CAMNT_0049349831 /DNA_START=16 /DNA_END=1137 /DNA_ORIENTATION=+
MALADGNHAMAKNGFEAASPDIAVIGESKTTVVKNGPNGSYRWATVYGGVWINLNETNFMTKYDIQINRVTESESGSIYIGISSNDQHCGGRYSVSQDNKNYSFRSDGVIHHNSKYFGMASSGYKSGDIVTLSINPFKQVIAFHKNGELVTSQQYNTSSQRRYKLAVSLYHAEDSISIINEGNVQQFKPPLKLSHSISPKIQTVANLQRKTQKLGHRLDASTDLISSMTLKNDVMTAQIRRLRQKLAVSQETNRKLQHENWSLKKQNETLANMYDHAQYSDWSVQLCLNWIVGIDGGKFLKYYEMLNVRMTEHIVDGQRLKELDYVDLKELGLIDVDDRKSLYRHIQLLVAKNKAYNDEGKVHLCSVCSSPIN